MTPTPADKDTPIERNLVLGPLTTLVGVEIARWTHNTFRDIIKERIFFINFFPILDRLRCTTLNEIVDLIFSSDQTPSVKLPDLGRLSSPLYSTVQY